MKNCGPFNTFQHETIIRNQIAFINHSQYPVKSSKDTFYVQATFVSLEGLDVTFNWIFFSKIQSTIIWNILPNFQEFWAKIWDYFNPYFLFLMNLNKFRPYLWTCPIVQYFYHFQFTSYKKETICTIFLKFSFILDINLFCRII